jgi:putative endonuclease
VTDCRKELGRAGESAAAAHLEAAGYVVLARNARTRYGELDVIALGRRTLVFAEVKALRGRGRVRAERALEAIGPAKRLQVRRLARAWLAEHRVPGPYETIRFDAIGVALGPAGRCEIEHVPGAF